MGLYLCKKIFYYRLMLSRSLPYNYFINYIVPIWSLYTSSK
jgi:hypothetical protein